MLPSPLTLLASVIAAFFTLLVAVRGPVDADLWWHLTTGRLIIQSGAVPSVDPYSFAYDGPWVAHEWLGEAIIAALVDSVGFTLTSAIFGLLVAAALLIPAYAMHRRGTPTLALLPWLAIGAYTLASYATVRPQVLSWVLLASLLVLLMGLSPTHRIRPWIVPVLFLAWANLHGLWVIGLGVLTVYTVFTVLGRTAMAGRAPTMLAVAAMSVGATALTPSGLAGLAYPLRYLRQDDWGTAFIAEWQPADFTDPRQIGVAFLILATILLGRRGAPGWLVVVAVASLMGALVAVRNAPIAVILTLPTVAIGLQGRLAPPRDARPVLARRRRLIEILAAVVVIVAMVVILPPAVASDVDDVFPAAALDELKERDSSPRLLADYDWGGFAIHEIFPGGGQVFIDGRSDMYPRQVFEDYLEMRSGGPDAGRLLDAYGVNAILLPPSAELTSQAGLAWCRAYVDERAVLQVPCP